ncbi:gliding motility-associated C-terminal domain-containing protein [bacterium]|nr:gliding motility-associated C-terminal domain-containing protein [bacterium]
MKYKFIQIFLILLFMLASGLHADSTFTNSPPGVLDNCPPRLTVTFPALGDTLLCSSDSLITWIAIDSFFNLNPILAIQYSVDGGGFITLTSNEANDSVWEWTGIPNLNSDSVMILITAIDSLGNQSSDTSDFFSIYCNLEGPLANIITPLPGYITSCNDQVILMEISDPNGVVDTTIRLYVSSSAITDTFWVMDTRLSYFDDTLRFDPGGPVWADGETIMVCLIQARDIFGNSLSGGPICWNFIIDLSPPEINPVYPSADEILSTPPESLVALIADPIAGVLPDSLYIIINGFRYGLPSVAINWSDPVFTFYPASAGLTFEPNDTVEVCIEASDQALYCGPNQSDSCWTFYISAGENPNAVILNPHDVIIDGVIYTACPTETVIIVIQDPDSNLVVDSITFDINGITLNLLSPGVSWTGGPGLVEIHYCPPGEWEDYDTILISNIYALDSIGNTIDIPSPSRTFITVFSPPLISNLLPPPSSVIEMPSLTVSFDSWDPLGRLRVDSLYITINGLPDNAVEGNALFLDDLENGDTICITAVCWNELADLGCPELTHRAESTWCFTISFGEGPSAIIVNPAEDITGDGAIWVACPSETISVLFSDPDANLLESSLQISVNGLILNITSPGVTWLGDSCGGEFLYFPPSSYGDLDSVIIEIINASDALGNTLTSVPEAVIFFLDFDNPIITDISPIPDTILPFSEVTVSFASTDSGIGIRIDSLYIEINGTVTNAIEDSLFFISGLEEGDSVCIIAVSWDGIADYGCPEVSHRAETTWCFNISFGDYPTATITLPIADTTGDGEIWTACEYQEIRVRFTDTDSNLVPDSLLIAVNYDTIDIYSAGAAWTGNSYSGRFSYTPPDGWSEHDTITVVVVRALDSLGNSLSFYPDPVTFYVDLVPPQISFLSPPPGEVISTPSTSISFSSIDLGMGVRVDSLYQEIDGVLISAHEGNSLIMDISDGDSVCITAVSWDRFADYGCPVTTHRAETTWCFTVSFGEGPSAIIRHPVLDLSGDGQVWVACPFETLLIEFYDPDSNMAPESIQVAVGSETMTIFSPGASWAGSGAGGELRFVPPGGWSDRDTIIIQVLAAADSLGNTMTSPPVPVTFYTDFNNPELSGFMPPVGSYISTPYSAVSFVSFDPGLRVRIDSIYVEIDGSPAGSFEGDSAFLDLLEDGDRVCITAVSWDNFADFGCPEISHRAETTWCFEVSISGIIVSGENLYLCPGESGYFGIATSGGTGPLSYTWTPTEYLSSPAIANPLVSPPTATTSDTLIYLLTVNDTLSITVVETFLVVRSSPMSITHSVWDTAICGGTTVDLIASVEGGLPPYLFEWHISEVGVITSPDTFITIDTTTTVELFVYDSIGCMVLASAWIGVCDTPAAFSWIYPAPGDTVPEGTLTLLWESSSVSEGYLTYDVYLDDTLIAEDISDTSATIGYIPCGENHTWNVIAYNNCFGSCTLWTSFPMEIPFNTEPCISCSLTIFGHDTAICYGQSVEFGVYAEGATGPLLISWNPIYGLSDPDALNPVVSPESTTTYILTVTDTAFATGCRDQDTFTVTVSPPMSTTILGDSLLCRGIESPFYPVFSGGIPPYSYDWLLNGDHASNDSLFWLALDSTTMLTLIITDTLGCSAISSAWIEVCDTITDFYPVSPITGDTIPAGPVLLVWTRASVSMGNITYDVYLNDSMLVAGINDTSTWTAPITCGEEHRWTVIAHSDCGECNFSNTLTGNPFFNTEPCLFPDLLIDLDDLWFQAPDNSVTNQINEGDSAEIFVVIQNIGAAPAYSFWTCLVINSTSWDSFWLDSLYPGEAETLISGGLFEEGPYEICASVDCAGSVLESDEANNDRCAVLYALGASCDAHPNPFSPNADMINDEVKFSYPGIAGQEGIIMIYNMNNILVRELENSLSEWNGLDDKGKLMPKGVYIYVIKKDSKVVCNGTIYLVR